MLGELLSPFSSKVIGNMKVNVTGISLDSRKVQKGDLFVALRGQKDDGKKFAKDAIEKGAVAILSEEALDVSVPVATLTGLRNHLSKIAANVYGNPANRLTMVGVTGTNGKTTTSILIEQLFAGMGKKAGYIGTLAYRWMGKEEDAPRTTPESTELQALLKKMVDDGVTHVSMECSSHGLELGRLNDIPYDIALFTNLTRDHLDFHPTMEAYEQAKRKLFDEILVESQKANRTAILNVDDPVGKKWASEIKTKLIRFSTHEKSAEIFAKKFSSSAHGMDATISVHGKEYVLRSPLVGLYNLSNLLGALAVANALGWNIDETLSVLSRVQGVAGRLERVPNQKNIHLFVDYAHTDDALRNVLEALKALKQNRILVVFGCGGDRDRGKRPRMAKAVSDYADVSIVTSDNPRTEKPENIIEEIMTGFPPAYVSNVKKLVDRKEAIAYALKIAKEGDIVLIAGKGHETYQEINGEKFLFDDRQVAREFFERGSHG